MSYRIKVTGNSCHKVSGTECAVEFHILALYLVDRKDGPTLEDYLDQKIFASMESETVEASPEDIEGFEKFTARYRDNIGIMRAAVETFKA